MNAITETLRFDDAGAPRTAIALLIADMSRPDTKAP